MALATGSTAMTLQRDDNQLTGLTMGQSAEDKQMVQASGSLLGMNQVRTSDTATSAPCSDSLLPAASCKHSDLIFATVAASFHVPKAQTVLLHRCPTHIWMHLSTSIRLLQGMRRNHV